MSTHTRVSASTGTRRSVLTIGLVCAGLAAPMALAAEAAPARQSAPRYVAEIVGDRAAPNEYSYGTRSAGVSARGDVLVTSSSSDPAVASPRRSRALAPADHLAPHYVTADSVSRSGDVVGHTLDGILRWKGSRVEIRRFQGDQSSGQGFTGVRLNAGGVVAGCGVAHRVGAPFVGRFDASSLTLSTWPKGDGNCSATGLSDAGVATVNQEAPSFRTDEVYPRAATLSTSSGVRYLRTPAGAGSSADGISPNGRHIVGRVTKGGVTTVSWLSHGRAPVALRGAGAMTPKVVTNSGVVLGEENGRVVLWQSGRKTDLTGATRLPRGWVISEVSGVNDAGQIAVTATASPTETVAMRLTPARGR